MIFPALQQQLQRAVAELGIEITSTEIDIEHPTDPEHGDYSTNLALKLSKEVGVTNLTYKNPRVLAEAIVDKLTTQSTGTSDWSSISVAGPGFINFALSETFLNDYIRHLIANPDSVISKNADGKKAIVEYSSPNIAKPLTIGHLRSIVIGDAVARLLAATGHQVFRDNHLGDWGTQFGKQIYAIKTWGSEEELDTVEHPVKKLVELYVKFHEESEANPDLDEQGRAWFKKIEDGDLEARRLWQKCIDWSWKEFAVIYDRLDVTFTENNGQGYGESYFEDKMGPVIEELKQKGIARESEGALVAFFPNDELPPLLIVKKDGATLYATRDLATDKFRLEHYGQDILVINEVGGEQALYFKQLYKLEQLLGWYKAGQRVHVKHGMYRFKDKKMSTRKGNVIWLADVLEEAFERVKKQANGRIDDDSIWKIATGALKWNDLRRSSHLDVIFDWDEILSLQGNSGPYLQYTYVRANSILEKSDFTSSPTPENRSIAKQIDSLLYSLNDSEKMVARLLTRFDETVQRAAKEYAPHYVCTYLFELAQAYNAFYATVQVLSETDENARQLRLELTKAVAITLYKGMGLIGMTTVTKM